MCLGMANGYRVLEKENINVSTKTNVKTIIEKTEEQLNKAETDAERIYLSAFLDGAKAQKEENQILIRALFPETEVWEKRLKAKDAEIQKLINERAYLKRKLAKSPENRFACCVCVEYGEIYTKSLADYDALLYDIRKYLIEDLERAYKARQLLITHEPVRYVRIPLSMFEKLVKTNEKVSREFACELPRPHINPKLSDDYLELFVCTRMREFIRELKAIANTDRIVSIDGKWAISQLTLDKLLGEWGVGVEKL